MGHWSADQDVCCVCNDEAHPPLSDRNSMKVKSIGVCFENYGTRKIRGKKGSSSFYCVPVYGVHLY